MEFLPWELERDQRRRHEACGAKVLDAEEPNFSAVWLQHMDEPLLIKNLIKHWAALERWTPEWYRGRAVEELDPTAIRPWNFTDPADPQCFDCDWTARWGPSPDRRRELYFEQWNARGTASGPAAEHKAELAELAEPNAVIFSPGHKCGTPDLEADAPLPEVFVPFCGNRHVAFSAYGTSHGLHRHSAAWQAQVVGFKSWWILPDDVYTRPEDQTTTKSPFGFPHEPQVQRANSLCGYRPTLPELRERLVNCVQGPGETMYVPNAWWHGTCALDNFTVGTGGGLFPRMSATFENRLSTAVKVLFVAAPDEAMHLDTVQPEQSLTMDTHSGHLFRFVCEGTGRDVGEFRVPSGQAMQHVYRIEAPLGSEL